MNKNAGKYLAAAIAMLMAVCAVAVVAMPAEAADTDAPTAEFGEAVAKPITSAEDIYELSGEDVTYDSTNKTLTIDQPTILSINQDVTISDLRIVLNADLKIVGEGKLDITATSKGTAIGAYTVSFNADDAVLVIDGANVTLDADETKGSVFNNMYTYDSTEDKWAAPGHDGAVQVVNEAVLTVNHTNGGSTWLGAPAEDNKAAWLIVNDATVNFDGTKSIQEIVVDADNADINFTDVLIGPSILAGSDFNASDLSVSGSDLNGIYVKGDIALSNGSSFEVTNASGTNADRPGLMISNVEETTITMDESSSISADTIGLTDKANGYSNTQNGVKIVGGAVSGTFTPVKTAADTPAKTQPAYALDGTKVTGNSIIDTGAVVAPADETGFIVDGNLRNKGTIDTTNGPVDVTGKLTNTATGVISGEKEITGTGSVINDGAIEVPVDNEDYTNNNMEEVFVYGNSQKSFWYPADQMVTVPAGQTWTIVAGGVIVVPGVLNVEGSLVLEEDATLVVGAVEDSPMNDNGTGTANIADTLTIEENAKLIISRGTVNIDGTANVDGSILVGYKMDGTTPSGVTATLNVNSDTTFSETSTVATTGAIKVAEGVTLTIEGAFKSNTTIDNYGAIIIDSEPIDPESEDNAVAPCEFNIIVNMLADGASVNIENLAINADKFFQATDKGLVTDSKTGAMIGDDDETLVKIDAKNSTVPGVISGISIVENFDGVKDESELQAGEDATMNSMEIAGTVSVAEANESDDEDAKVYGRLVLVEGDFTVSDNLSIGKNITLELSSYVGGVTLAVSGYVPVNADGAITNSGEITLSGEGHIYMAGKDIAGSGVVNAAYYNTEAETVTYSNYVTVDAAIVAANADSTIEEILHYGENTVTVSATVPAIDFTFKDDKTVLNIGTTENRDVRLDIAAGATYGKTGTTDVKGTLYFNDKTNLKADESTIKADVVSYEVDEDGKLVRSGWAMYTNIYTAMTEAEAGDIINVFDGANVELDRDFTVKEGVTLVVPEGGAKITVMDGVTLTVAGTLQSDAVSEGVVAEHSFAKTASATDETSAIVVTGTLKAVETIGYAPANGTLAGSMISGAYYEIDDYNVVTTLATAVSAEVLPTVISDAITIYGTVTEGDIAFAATEECLSIDVAADAKLTLSSLVLSDEAVFNVHADGFYTGTVTVGDASIETVNIQGAQITSVNGLTIVTADVTYNDEKTDAPIDASLNATAGTVVVDSVTGDMTVDAEATLAVPNVTTGTVNTDGIVDGDLTVNGTVSIVNEQRLTVTGGLFVNGTVTVADETETDAMGTIVVGTLTEGVGDGTLYIGLDKELATTSSTASVAGFVNAQTVYVASGATVSEATVDERDPTAYYVEDALWLTAYGVGDIQEINSKNVPVENAYFAQNWLTAEGEKATGAYGNEPAVYAEVEYDVYIINLKADHNAVSSITIDGNVMNYGMIYDKANNNYYYGYTAVVAAGSHTIQYQLTNGYSGNGVLTVNGKQMADLSFTAEGTPTEKVYGDSNILYKTYDLQLTGFEKSGYVPDSPDTGDSGSSDDGMTITDYLLIVLVVLIIVMAIIVAMRLMRS